MPRVADLLTSLLIETFDSAGFITRRGKMSLLDLAGSEKVDVEALGDRTAQAEARDTAASLQAVGEVLWSVLHKDPRVPYNDHVVTKVPSPCVLD